MSYNPAIPNRGDFTSISQKQMLSNFQAINETYLIDHVPLTSVVNVGKHNALTMRPQAVDPVTGVDQSALYTKLDANLLPQLFFRPSSNQTPIQMTNSNLNTAQTGSGVDQSSFLAGPFTIYMGYVVNCANLTPITLTGSTNLLYVGLSTKILGGNFPAVNIAAAVNIVGNTFDIRYNPLLLSFSPAPTIYYMAIGQ